MAYDFPASPTENQEYIPVLGGQTYVYKAPRWLVKGIPPAGGGGGSGIGEAPEDGEQYGRQDADWTVVEPGVSDWADITGKPATFPPTVPIPWTDVSGKPATFPPTVPIAWTDVSGKPATFPPTLPIGQSDVTGLTAALAAKAPLNSPVLTGNPTGPTPAAADSSGSLATTSFVKVQGYATPDLVTAMLTNYAPLFSPIFTGDPKAPTPSLGDNDTSIATTAFVKAAVDAKLAVAAIADTAPSSPVHGQLWWSSNSSNLYIWYNDGTSSQWVQINSVGT